MRRGSRRPKICGAADPCGRRTGGDMFSCGAFIVRRDIDRSRTPDRQDASNPRSCRGERFSHPRRHALRGRTRGARPSARAGADFEASGDRRGNDVDRVGGFFRRHSSHFAVGLDRFAGDKRASAYTRRVGRVAGLVCGPARRFSAVAVRSAINTGAARNPGALVGRVLVARLISQTPHQAGWQNQRRTSSQGARGRRARRICRSREWR